MEITKKTHAPHTKYSLAPTPHTLVEIRPSRPSNRSHRLPPPPPYDGHFRWHRSNGTAFDFRVRVMGGWNANAAEDVPVPERRRKRFLLRAVREEDRG